MNNYPPALTRFFVGEYDFLRLQVGLGIFKKMMYSIQLIGVSPDFSTL
jgi:hypothetical protein